MSSSGCAHGGLFRTAGVAQRFLAGALGAPVAVGELAAEGGAWGIAVLGSYLAHADRAPLEKYLDDDVFASAELRVIDPDPADVAGVHHLPQPLSRGPGHRGRRTQAMNRTEDA